MKRVVTISHALVISLILTGVIAKAQDKGDPVLIRTAQVQYEQRSFTVHGIGRLENKQIMRLSFNIGGLIEQMLVDDGDHVTQGQLLSVLDSDQIEAEVAAAESNHVKTKQDAQRFRSLFERGLVSSADLQEREADYAQAQSVLATARFNRKLSKIHAPLNGRVMRRVAEENELVNAKQTVLELSAEEKGWIINADVTDKDIVRLNLGDQASIKLSAFPQLVFRGTVTLISEEADAETGLFAIEVALEKGLPNFRSGYMASVDIAVANEQALYYLPIDALVDVVDGMAVVYSYDSMNNSVTRHDMEIAYLGRDEIGLVGSDGFANQVVTSGAKYLSEHSRVQRVE